MEHSKSYESNIEALHAKLLHIQQPRASDASSEQSTNPEEKDLIQLQWNDSSTLQQFRYNVNSIPSLLKTIWRFPLNDLKTMVLPVTIVGLANAFSGPHISTSIASPVNLIWNLSIATLWTWLNVLILSISNQRSSQAILEDTINKPWRPIPSGRITPDQARQLLLVVVPLVIVFSTKVGVMRETMWCLVGSWYYSDIGGGDENFLLRNVLNGVAYLAYGCGTSKLMLGVEHNLQPSFYTWLFIIASVVGTTIQIQDLKDEEGDRARNRHTAPVVVGDGITRWTVIAGVGIWSVACPLYWQVGLFGSLTPVSFGLIVSLRVWFLRGCQADRSTFLLWSWWMISLFTLPVIKELMAGLS